MYVQPTSDAGNNGVEPASGHTSLCHQKPSDFVLHVVLDIWGTLLRRGLRFVQWRRTRNSVKERDSTCAWINGVALHQYSGDFLSCSEQAYFNKPSTGHGYERAEAGCVLTVLRVPFIIHPMRNADA